jgi:RecB family endonuclease NucS
MTSTQHKARKGLTMRQETTFKKGGILKRQNLKRWIENQPEILLQELLVVTTGYDKLDKRNERLDLLAINKDGKLVVVELKRNDSGKRVELQSIKYAAYCSTRTLADVARLYSE